MTAVVAQHRAAAGGLLYLLVPLAVAAQEVVSDGGDIYFGPKPSGDLLRVTATGLDREPDLSSDAKRIVFVRGTPPPSVERPTGNKVEETELWIVKTDGSEPRLLLRGGSAANRNGVPVADFRSPQFSPNGEFVYFLSMAGVVSDIAYAIDLKSGRLREVCGANSLLVVRKGNNAGNLVVTQHRYFVGGGSYDWAWLVDPDGKEIGTLGDPNADGFDIRLRDVVGEERKSLPK